MNLKLQYLNSWPVFSYFSVSSCVKHQTLLSESVYTGGSKLPWKPKHFICSQVWAFHGSDCNWNCFLEKETTTSSETSVHVCQITHHYVPEDAYSYLLHNL